MGNSKNSNSSENEENGKNRLFADRVIMDRATVTLVSASLKDRLENDLGMESLCFLFLLVLSVYDFESHSKEISGLFEISEETIEKESLESTHFHSIWFKPND